MSRLATETPEANLKHKGE